jgi:hypothetical protein
MAASSANLYHDFLAPARTALLPSVSAHIAGAAPLPPGGFGTFAAPSAAHPFRNVRARTRAERRREVNRDGLEKERLRARREGFGEYAEPGAVIAPDARDSDSYLGDGDRFFSDIGAEQRHARDEAQQKRQADVVRRREQTAEREQARWAKMEEETRAFAERTVSLQRDGRPALKNVSGAPYNPVTQAYLTGPEADKMKEQEQFVLFRASQRAEFLHTRGAGSSFNPLTGAQDPKPSFRIGGQ